MPRTETASHHRVPEDARLRELALVLVLVLVAVTLVEVSFRNRGILPSQRDTVRLWGTQRVALSRSDRPTVFLGSSRIQHAIHLETLEAAFPQRDFFQLAVVGSSPLELLERLSDDETFAGVVVVEFYPTYLFGSSKADDGLLHAWLAKFDARSWVDDVESRLRIALKDRLVVGNVETRPTFILYNAVTKSTLPRPTHVRIHADRWQEADFSNYDATGWRDDGKYRLKSPELRSRLDSVARNVEKIRSRGGDVIFLRTITSGNVRKREDELYPRHTHFDRFVKGVNARSLHFEDIEEMARLECPDGRHLDADGARTFTAALADTFAERKFLVTDTLTN